MKSVSIGLIGDYNKSVVAHQAIPSALQQAGTASGVEVYFNWVPTNEIISIGSISHFDGLWCVPGSPYRNMDGALLAIRYAREHAIPFLGTCAGFQHVVIEHARNVLGWSNAEHAETAPDAERTVIAPLECSLVEAKDIVRFFPGSRIAAAYGTPEAEEGYHCRYGLNPAFRNTLLAGPLRASAEDANGEVRAIEQDGHPFFVATLFQPERAALVGKPAPIVEAFVQTCAA